MFDYARSESISSEDTSEIVKNFPSAIITRKMSTSPIKTNLNPPEIPPRANDNQIDFLLDTNLENPSLPCDSNTFDIFTKEVEVEKELEPSSVIYDKKSETSIKKEDETTNPFMTQSISACLCTKINSINENTSKSNETITQKLNNMEFYQEYVLTEINGKSDSHSDKLDQILGRLEYMWKQNSMNQLPSLPLETKKST